MKTFLTLTTPLGPLSVGATAEAVTDIVFGNAPAGAVTGTTPVSYTHLTLPTTSRV